MTEQLHIEAKPIVKDTFAGIISLMVGGLCTIYLLVMRFNGKPKFDSTYVHPEEAKILLIRLTQLPLEPLSINLKSKLYSPCEDPEST